MVMRRRQGLAFISVEVDFDRQLGAEAWVGVLGTVKGSVARLAGISGHEQDQVGNMHLITLCSSSLAVLSPRTCLRGTALL